MQSIMVHYRAMRSGRQFVLIDGVCNLSHSNRACRASNVEFVRDLLALKSKLDGKIPQDII